MRVLEAITPSRIGGAEVFVAGLCEALPGLGAEVELFCPAGRPFVGYTEKRGLSSTTWKTYGKFDPLTVFKLAQLIRRAAIDVVHTHLSTACLLGAFAARLTKRASVAHVHGLNTATCYRRSTAIIAVSNAVKEHLCAQGVEAGKIRVVHNGIDLTAFEPADMAEAKTRLGLEPQTPLFGVFGRLSTEKGQRVAIEAISILLADHPEAKLLLVGEGRDPKQLQHTVTEMGLDDQVIFTGFAQDVRPLMSACNAVVVPSSKEGFGLTAVEAMALEKPVIASAVGGLTEIVVHGETGFAVPPNSPEVIAGYLRELIRDRSLAERMGKRGRERALECFDRSKQHKLLLSILRDLA